MKKIASKNHCQKLLNRNGSALLITILIMGILLIVTLGLSKLIIGDVHSTADFVSSGKAYYAAEAGLETALLELKQNLAGYENSSGTREFNADQNYKANYTIANQTTTFPYRDPANYQNKTVRPQEFYETLPLNESITIPLFIVDENGDTQNVEEFRVEYYVGYNTRNQSEDALKYKIQQDDVDVLRWKIFGLTKEGSDFRTEAISDYFPVLKISDAQNPMCLGTPMAVNQTTDPNNSLSTKCANTNVDASFAREHYENKGGETYYYSKDPYGFEEFIKKSQPPTDITANETPPGSEPIFDISGSVKLANPTKPNVIVDPDNIDIARKNLGPGYPIQKFMEEHQNKYLTLTNIINPSVIEGDSETIRKAIANIRYRVVIYPGTSTQEKKTVREFATIRSEGFFNDIKQTIEANIRMDQFLPVFNFSLYRTNTESTPKVQ